MQKYENHWHELVKEDTGDFYLVSDVDQVVEDKDIAYSILNGEYEQKWGLSMRLQSELEKKDKEIANLRSVLDDNKALIEAKIEEIAYYKERACCDPINKWGHTAECWQNNKWPAKDGWKKALQNLREENAKLKALIETQEQSVDALFATEQGKIIAVQAKEIATLKAALSKIAKGEGAYSRDHLTHAKNTIDSMKRMAQETLKEAENEP